MIHEKRSVTVRIAGEEHTIRANVEPAYTLRCARHVDARIQEIRGHAGLIEGHKAAILAALSIADEYFETQRELDELRRAVGQRTRRMVERMRAEIAGAGPEG